jgi:hypothetical protein
MATACDITGLEFQFVLAFSVFFIENGTLTSVRLVLFGGASCSSLSAGAVIGIPLALYLLPWPSVGDSFISTCACIFLATSLTSQYTHLTACRVASSRNIFHHNGWRGTCVIRSVRRDRFGRWNTCVCTVGL